MKSKSILKFLMIFAVVLSIPLLVGWGWNKPITNPEVAISDVDGRMYVIDINNRMKRVKMKNDAFDATISPNGAKIAYNNRGLWVCNIDGTGQKLVSKKGGLPIAWSPSGKEIAFETRDDTGGGIWLVEISGKNIKFLIDAELLGWVDSKIVACGRGSKTYLLDIDTLNTKKIIARDYSSEPSLSYSGDKIIYLKRIGKRKLRKGGRLYSTIKNIYVSGIYGRNKKLLAKEKPNMEPRSRIFTFENLKWGRSGKKIFYNAQPLVFESGQYMCDRRLYFVFRSSYYFLMYIEINDNNEFVKKTILRKVRYLY